MCNSVSDRGQSYRSYTCHSVSDSGRFYRSWFGPRQVRFCRQLRDAFDSYFSAATVISGVRLSLRSARTVRKISCLETPPMSFAASVRDSRKSFFHPWRLRPGGRSLYRSARVIRSRSCSPSVRHVPPTFIASPSADSWHVKTMYFGFSDLSSFSDAKNTFISLGSTLVRVPRDSFRQNATRATSSVFD